MGLVVRITCNGSHFGLSPSEIHRMTGLPPKIVWTMTYSHTPHCRHWQFRDCTRCSNEGIFFWRSSTMKLSETKLYLRSVLLPSGSLGGSCWCTLCNQALFCLEKHSLCRFDFNSHPGHRRRNEVKQLPSVSAFLIIPQKAGWRRPSTSGQGRASVSFS